jgi:hypothetical protein
MFVPGVFSEMLITGQWWDMMKLEIWIVKCVRTVLLGGPRHARR